MNSDGNGLATSCTVQLHVMQRLRSLCFAAVCGLAALGCTELDPVADSCAVFGNCDPAGIGGDQTPGNGGSGGAVMLSDIWDCLDDAPTGPPMNAMRPPITYVVPIVDFANPPTRPEGLVITVCQGADAGCTNPVPHQESAVPMQPPAVVAITLPYGFDGYLRLTATNYVTTEYYMSGPMIGARDGATMFQGIAIPMLRDGTMTEYFGDLQQTRDLSAGVLAIRSIQCDGRPAENVKLVMDEPTRGFGYTLINNQPVAADPPLPTDTRGVAGYANVSPGGTAVQGFIGNTRIGRSAFRVRANQLTVGEIRIDAGLYGR